MTARRLQLSGWVRNRPDGSVEVAASGSEDRLAELRKTLGRGPDGAEVAGVADLDEVSEDMEYPFAMRK